ncbi:uncharacterized protein PRCAT00005964001 [Priceomyces carsonii]|uniref:uncharacterized protein n=1 Tax=Priceomyces carsonii TaxID=28549 RepID=UPI002ED97C63|nr:unnamed protein product [Priceomyces carsonii]
MIKPFSFHSNVVSSTICLLVFSLFGFIWVAGVGERATISKRFEIVHAKRDDGFTFRIYSNNIRYNATNLFEYEQPWEVRKAGVLNAIKSKDTSLPILVSIQECLHNQLIDLKLGLNEQTNSSDYPWTHFGVGRDDGQEAGEYSPILYNTNDWELLNGTSRWLSTTPLTPSIFPGADTKRIVTITTFKHKATGKILNYFNTHLDQQSQDARTFGVNEILTYMSEVPNTAQTFFSGDFNSLRNDTAYITVAQHMKDTELVAYKHINDSLPTYSGFNPQDDLTGGTIDFIWATENTNNEGSPVSALSHEVVDNLYDGYRFSDHRPVTAVLKLEEN